MIKILLLFVLFIAFIIELFKKYVLKIKEPTVEELMPQLEKEEWFQELCKHKQYKEIIESSKERGILTDENYVSKLLHHQGTIDGFKRYIKERAKKR